MSNELEKYYRENKHLFDSKLSETINMFEESVKKKHKKVSGQKTNPNHVKQKAGMDYVEFGYMKNKANEFYPLWSFKNLKIVHEFLMSGWVVVQGELHFIDEGVPRVGAVAAAHRIAFKSGEPRTPDNIVDLGNDVKAAVSDAIKKAFNVYMNISDDIYRTFEIENISNTQKSIAYEIISKCSPESQRKFYNFVDNSVFTNNYTETCKKLLSAAWKHQVEEEEEEVATKIITELQEELKKIGTDITKKS